MNRYHSNAPSCACRKKGSICLAYCVQTRLTFLNVLISLIKPLKLKFTVLCLVFGAIGLSPQAIAQSCQSKLVSQEVAQAQMPSGELTGHEHWQTIEKLPDRWKDRWDNYSGTAWYRLKWQYTCQDAGSDPLSLMVSYINMAGQVYLNGQLFWQDDSLQEPLSRSWNMPRQWVIPPNSLKQGQNEVLIRVVGVNALNPGLGEVSLNRYHDNTKVYEKHWLAMRGLHSYTTIFEFILGVIAGLVWLFRREENAFGWYAITSFLWVLYVGQLLATETLWGLSTLDFYRLHIFIFLCFTTATCLYPWRFAGRKFPRLEKVMGMTVFVLGCLIFLHHSLWYNLS